MESRQQSDGSGVSKAERMVVVATTAGLLQAQILVGSLRAAGLEAKAIQEGAGRAIGLTVGLLGSARVLVPESQAEQATAILRQPEEDDAEQERNGF